ncbi:MAG TPA: hypothetical protein VJP40_01040, partial [bacterium]|nr:hypothetical protein [bacterium]
IKLFVQAVADKALEGMKLREAQARRAGDRDDDEKPQVREARGEKASAYVGRRDEKAEGEEADSGSYSAKVQPEPEAPAPTETTEE